MNKHLFKVHFTRKRLKAQHKKRKIRQELIQNETEKVKSLEKELQKTDKRVIYSLGILFVVIVLGINSLVACYYKQMTLSYLLMTICFILIGLIIHIWKQNEKAKKRTNHLLKLK